jgi:broad specificity phosphatase PhoE
VTRLVLVRHGRAAAEWAAGGDPGLDAVGRAQADAMAEALASELGETTPWPVVVSPLQRTRETAAALERSWRTTARVEPGVGEIPTLAGVGDRAAWLGDALRSSWADLGPDLQQWREQVVETLLASTRDTVFVTHFVAINAAVGRAEGHDRVVTFAPDHCSRTVLEVDAGVLRVVELGAQARRTTVR